MKKILKLTICILLFVLLTGCGESEEADTMPIFSNAKTVGKDIQKEDITDFYYTVENINYDAFYQRYRFYVEDGKYFFFHETRERKNDYGPCTENDTTKTGTVELTEDQWSGFYELVKGGAVKAREESSDSGGTGPWLYLYWTNDKAKYQQFSFASYATEEKFVKFCEALAAQPKE
ncbi:MAG: hypothetical protein IK078_00265 [Lachnospiraceae bacterium]|nr:hypothetical protein [Lachnospiraceae bacterium]